MALQGNLFGDPEPAAATATNPSEPAAGALSDADLGADAAARPRQRKTAESRKADLESEPEQPAETEHLAITEHLRWFDALIADFGHGRTIQ